MLPHKLRQRFVALTTIFIAIIVSYELILTWQSRPTIMVDNGHPAYLKFKGEMWKDKRSDDWESDTQDGFNDNRRRSDILNQEPDKDTQTSHSVSHQEHSQLIHPPANNSVGHGGQNLKHLLADKDIRQLPVRLSTNCTRETAEKWGGNDITLCLNESKLLREMQKQGVVSPAIDALKNGGGEEDELVYLKMKMVVVKEVLKRLEERQSKLNSNHTTYNEAIPSPWHSDLAHKKVSLTGNDGESFKRRSDTIDTRRRPSDINGGRSNQQFREHGRDIHNMDDESFRLSNRNENVEVRPSKNEAALSKEETPVEDYFQILSKKDPHLYEHLMESLKQGKQRREQAIQNPYLNSDDDGGDMLLPAGQRRPQRRRPVPIVQVLGDSHQSYDYYQQNNIGDYEHVPVETNNKHSPYYHHDEEPQRQAYPDTKMQALNRTEKSHHPDIVLNNSSVPVSKKTSYYEKRHRISGVNMTLSDDLLELRNYGIRELDVVDRSLPITFDFSSSSDLKQRRVLLDRVMNGSDSVQRGLAKLSLNDDLLERAAFQGRQMDGFCSANGLPVNLPSSTEDLNILFQHLLYDDKRKIVFCYVPKNGCSNMKRMMLILNGILPSNSSREKRPPEQVLKQVHSFRNLSKIEALYKLEHYFKFAIVRNPMERLLSAYKNKLELPFNITLKKHFPERLKAYILNKYRKKEFLTWIVRGKNDTDIHPSFGEFLQFMVKFPLTYYNEHFKPSLLLCYPCSVHYDLFLNFKTLEYDVYALLELLGIPKEYYPVSIAHKSAPTSSHLEGYYGNVLPEQKAKLFHTFAKELELYYSLYPEEWGMHKDL